MTILRDYQQEAIADIHKRWEAGDTRVPLVLATGLGKTEIFTSPELAGRWLEENPGQRMLILAHTNELIEQAAKKARRNLPTKYSIGIVKAGLNETHCRVIVSSRQTLASEKRRNMLRNVGLIVVDECHHAVRTNTYGKILEHFRAWDNGCKVLGFTATLARSDKVKLSTVWQDVTFRRDIIFGIRNGYLLDVSGERVIVPDLDMNNVKQSRGDYQDAAIAEELERTFAPQIVAERYAEAASSRLGIAFWPLVDTAYHGAKAFEEVGISSAVIHGGLPKEERRLILKRFHEREIQVIHNCMVLTEGFDEPRADVVVIARPTRSAALYQQMVGRVLRPNLELEAPARGKALILDVTGASEDNDLRCLIDLSPERKLDPNKKELSLLELDDEYELILEEINGGGGFFPEEHYVGKTVTKAFDPLNRDKLWSKTDGGAWFLSAEDGYVFLADSLEGDPGTYDVVLQKPGKISSPHRELPLDMALSFGEELAVAEGGQGAKTLLGRKSWWRKAAPTDAQITYAARMGIETHGATKGELSEAISRIKASRKIDPLIKRITKGRS